MGAGDGRDRWVPQVRWIGQPRLTAGLDQHQRLALANHRAIHGRPPRLPVGALVALARSVDLRGRGGAAFPVARKLQAVAARVGRRRAAVVLVNATEGEPASAKDKMLLTRAPHLVLDGAMLAASALQAREVVIGGSPTRGRATRWGRRSRRRMSRRTPGWSCCPSGSSRGRAAPWSGA
jgi:hypothetical protein